MLMDMFLNGSPDSSMLATDGAVTMTDASGTPTPEPDAFIPTGTGTSPGVGELIFQKFTMIPILGCRMGMLSGWSFTT